MKLSNLATGIHASRKCCTGSRLLRWGNQQLHHRANREDAGPVSAAHLAIEARHAGCHAVRTRVLLAVEYWPQLTRQFTLATVDDG